MDELEISGKRYISTKRAGKEHGYHSDYVGQLIRGKKVIGQKVGRSWYVDELSLAEYLGKETPEQPIQKVEPVVETPEPVVEQKVIAPKVEQPAPVAEEIKEVVEVKFIEPVVEEKVIEEVVQVVEEEKPIQIKTYAPEIIQERKVATADGYRVAIHTPAPSPTLGGLKYVEDQEPLLPETGERAVTTVMKVQERLIPADAVTPKRKFSFVQGAFVVVTGLALCAATAAACTYTASKVMIEEGKSASVNYAIDF